MLNSMKVILPICMFLVHIISSCGCDGNTEFDKRHLAVFNLYEIGDTLFFSNENGDLHTVEIAEKQEWVQNCLLSSKSINVIHHPKNRWFDGHEATEQGLRKLNQSMISIGKEIAPQGHDQYSEYSIYIKYRNFHEKLEDSIKPTVSQIFNYLGINKFHLLKNSETKLDSTDVSEIYWSNEFGIIGYKLKNNDVFKLKN